MKNIKKISILMAIFTAGQISHLVARPGGSHDMNASSAQNDHAMNPGKAIAVKSLAGPGGEKGDKSSMAAMAGMASMASSENSGDSSGSGGSGDSSTPTTPTPPAPAAPADIPAAQYAAAPNTGVPTTVPSGSTTPTSPATPVETPAATSEKTASTEKDVKDEKEHKDPVAQKPETVTSHEEEDHAMIVQDQDAILEKIKEINMQDDHVHHTLNNASMNLLFNNFVHLKDFIVQNFTKNKMLELCIEFINQIYPSEHVKVISMNQPEQAAATDNSQEQSQEQNESTQMPEMEQNDNQGSADVSEPSQDQNPSEQMPDFSQDQEEQF